MSAINYKSLHERTAVNSQSVFAAANLKKSYGSIHALNGVSIEVYKREILALVGDNGAGKSTLIRVLSGLETPDSGKLYLSGSEVVFPNIGTANCYGVSSIFQNPEVCLSMEVVDNIYMGHELMKGLFVDRKRMIKESYNLLNKLGSNLIPTQIVRGLSDGERQTLMFARSLLLNPQVLLLDEPTSSLSVIQTADFLDQLLCLRDLGKTIIMVCHNLPDVFAVSDRICVMRHGQILNTLNVRDTTYDKVVSCMTGASTF